MKKFIVWMGLVTLPAAAGTIIDTYPDWDGNVTYGWLATAQTITAPSDNVLLNYRFALAPRATAGTVLFSVFAWGATGPIGSALYSTVLPWSDGGDVDVTIINLALTTGALYGMVIDLLGYSDQSVHFQYNQSSYTGGNGWWYDGSWVNFPGLNHKFRAEFTREGVIPEPATMLLVAAGLGLLGWRRKSLALATRPD